MSAPTHRPDLVDNLIHRVEVLASWLDILRGIGLPARPRQVAEWILAEHVRAGRCALSRTELAALIGCDISHVSLALRRLRADRLLLEKENPGKVTLRQINIDELERRALS